MASTTDRREDYLVTVDSDGHEGEWLQMVACPIPHCGATRGEDYYKYAAHLRTEHGPEDLGLSPGRRVATDGGTVEDDTECDGMLGFFDERGKWITVSEVEQELGDELDHPVRESLEGLADIDFLNVRRNDDGEIVTAQLSEFAADLYELPEDADVGRYVGVFQEHGKEIPEDLKDEYWEKFHENVRGGRDA
ncbi:hypothetical protein [Halosimplex pelagicum]|uniref:Uncharacterized protein n=1 Tax=Halosimplex pelagicum TaxID=869886 RepID=A0A7D5TBY6_9EURY|nr:hypothetical protein [Halosimplex pelagicum]QLH82433.1 hypothetical protein HZS54_12765 [Halosimplex pelagicum]QLH82489.1 hypothetical protein HZS54_13070 [Halosimplex pelagicum]